MAEQLVPVTVQLPAHEWWKLAKIADSRGIKVAQLVAERATRDSAGRPAGTHRTNTIDRVAELHADGLSDRDIALRLQVSKPTVRYHRLRLGVESNPPRR